MQAAAAAAVVQTSDPTALIGLALGWWRLEH